MSKKLLITGAAGALGRSLVGNLRSNNSGAALALLDLDKDVMRKNIADADTMELYDLQDFEAGSIDFSCVDAIVHCAFARSQAGSALAQSIDFTKRIFEYAAAAGVKRVINISSQSVYGNYRTAASSEKSPVDPHDLYAVAKYSCEKIGEVIFAGKNTQFVNVRMASLVGLPYPERIINKMIKFALAGNKIKIVGGSQLFSFLHIEDAATALALLAGSDSGNLQKLYNLGTSECYSIKELASVIAAAIEKKTGNTIAVETEEADVKYSIPLDVTAFTADLEWSARIRLPEIVSEIVDAQLASGK